MTTFEITKECTYCWGTGKNPAYVPEGEAQETCPKCNGTGRVESGQIDDIETTLNDMKDKLDTLQSDMDIIKPQIQALYDDLNL